MADGAVSGRRQLREKLAGLVLSNEGVLARERKREATLGKVEAPWFIQFPFSVLCWTLDVVYANRPVQRCAAAAAALLPATILSTARSTRRPSGAGAWR